MLMSHTSRKSFTFVLAALALLATVTACGGSASTDSASGTAESLLPSNVMGAPLDNPVLDFSGTYTVTSIFRGDGECLDANYGNESSAEHGGAYLAACNQSAGQKWQIQKTTPGLYQLKSTSQDGDVCLNGNDITSPLNDGAAFSEPCQDVAEQLWTVEPTADGYLRFHSKLYADTVCLESNQAGSEVHGGSTFMDDCQEVSGQYWYLNNA